MPANPPLTEIAKAKANLEAITERILNEPELLPEVIAGLRADKATVKFRCLKVLRLVSEKQPAALYPMFDQVAGFLGSDNTILKWGAIIIVGNLASADSENKIEALLDRYLEPISGPALISAANTIGGAVKMALAKPHLADRIVQVLLQVESAKYQTRECRNVALGHVLKGLEQMPENLRSRQDVIAFATRQLRNRRNAVKQRARAFLKRQEKPSPRPLALSRQSRKPRTCQCAADGSERSPA